MLIIYNDNRYPVTKKATISYFAPGIPTICGGLLANKIKRGRETERHALIIENRWPAVQIDATRAKRFPMDRGNIDG